MRGLLWAVVLTACASDSAPPVPEKPETREPPPNIVLIVLDTVRADHLSAYGYERPTTPHIDALARHGVRYANAVSTAPWTLPSHASMFTGLPPHAHGAHGFMPEAPNQNDVYPLRDDVPVLAEALRAQGYKTAAFAANNVFLTRRWGLHRGFDTYEVRHRHAGAHNRVVLRWLDENARADEPFFLFVNYIDAHRPYNIVPRAGFVAELDEDPRLIDQLRRRVMGTDDPVPEELRQRVIDQYDNAIVHMDDAVAEIVLELRRRGMLDDTVLAITSDHGEYFGEHRLVEHNMDVYEAGIRVPLIVFAAGRGPEVEPAVVTSEDLPAILASFVQLKRVRDALRTLETGPGTHPPLAENYYSRPWDVFSEIWGHRFQRIRRAVYEWPYKLIHSSDGAHELYQLELDPDEAHDLAEQHPDVTARLSRIVEADLADAVEGRARDATLDPTERAQMRALGYIE